MYDHHKVATLDNLIEYIKEKEKDKDKEKDSNYDISYQRRLIDFLENKIKNEYGNITVVAASFLVEKYNKRGSNEISEENERYYENNEFANLFEERLRLKTKSKKYYLISIEYDNGYPILISGKPDGLNREDNKAKIFEVKSFNLTTFIQFVKEPKDHTLIKKVPNIIKTSSSQLILYQYLLDKTQKFGLIGKIDKINLYGKIYFYSDNIGYLSWARKIIERNFDTIKRYAKTYNAYNLSLKDGEIININNKKVYYFEIDFRVEYNPKIVENYLKNLNELIKSLK